VLMSFYDAKNVIKAHLAGHNAMRISTELYLDLPAVQQVIANYKSERAAQQAAFKQVDMDIILDARRNGNINVGLTAEVVELYGQGLTARQIAKKVGGLKSLDVQAIIKTYNEN